MKKFFYFPVKFLAFFLLSNLLSAGNEFSANRKHDFIDSRLDKEFDLQQICREHSEEALVAYNKAAEDTSNLNGIIPYEVLVQVKSFKEQSFRPYNSKNPNLTLFEICARKVANANLDTLNQEEVSFINTLRSIIFCAKFNVSYYPPLAKMLIRFHLDKNYKPRKKVRYKNKYVPTKQLNECLCLASYLGDANAVQLLLSKGATADFVNEDDDHYTPLAYAIIQEHKYSKIRHKTSDIKLLIHNFEHIAEMLVKGGAEATRIIGRFSDHSIFLHTSNVKIFSLFKNQVDEIVRIHKTYAKNEITRGNVKRLGRDIVINAFKIGNTEFIKTFYFDRLYRKCVKKESQSFMNLAIKYYKGYDFKELFEFMVENSAESVKPEWTVKEFADQCLTNALNALDFESIKNLAEVGLSLRRFIKSDNSTFLIYCIKKANEYSDKNNLIKIIELLIDAYVRPGHKDNNGKTALDYAKEKDLDNDIGQALIMGPLMLLIKRYSPKYQSFVIKLINLANEQGGEIGTYKDSHGKTALDYAEEFNLDCSVIEILRSYTIQNFS